MSDWTPPAQSRVEAYFKELNNWGRRGGGDQVGTVNLITAAKRAQDRERADVVLDRFDLVYHGYTVTHIDALCHVAWDGQLYNGRPFMQSVTAAGATWCPIDPLFDGITTRGVLLDVAAAHAAAARAGVRVEPGDVVVVRSGQEAFQRAHPEWVPRVSPHPGLHVSCLEWFRERDIAAIAWDMMDERPSGYPGSGRSEFLFTATPIRLVGSTGAPAHPLAIL